MMPCTFERNNNSGERVIEILVHLEQSKLILKVISNNLISTS